MHIWRDCEIKHLFTLRSDMEREFCKATAHTALWSKIEGEMKAAGYSADAAQCVNKWKSMKCDWLRTVDHNNKSGKECKTCRFYEQFNNLFGHRTSA